MLCRKKKCKGIMAVIDRLLFFSSLVPPAYIIYRFIRWYVRQAEVVDDVGNADSESAS